MTSIEPWVLRVRRMDDKADVHGRPLDESLAPAAMQAGVPLKMVKCPYKDVRHGHPRMNASALKQMVRAWDDVLAVIAGLRGAWQQHQQVEHVTLLELCRLAHMMEVLPSFLVANADLEIGPSEVPVAFALLHKVALGISISSQVLYLELVDGTFEREADESLGALIYRHANDRKILLGEHGDEACAGPPARIEAVLAAMTTSGAGPVALPALLEGRLDRLVRFAAASLAELSGTLIFATGERIRLDAIASVAEGSALGAAAAAALAEGFVPSMASRVPIHSGEWFSQSLVEQGAAAQAHHWRALSALTEGYAAAPVRRALAALQATVASPIEGGDSTTEAIFGAHQQAAEAYAALLTAVERELRAAAGLDPLSRPLTPAEALQHHTMSIHRLRESSP